MLFILLGIFFSLVIFISLSDVEGKRIEKEKEEWKKIMGRDYK